MDMEQSFAPAPSLAMLLDPAATQSVIEHLSKLELPRRVCRPLDHRRAQSASSELEQFDAAIDAAAEAETASDQKWDEIEPALSGA